MEDGMLSTASVAASGNPLIDALTWGSKWTSGLPSLTIKVGIQTIGGLVPTAAEVNAITSMLVEFERVINVDFVYVGTAVADVTFKFCNDIDDGRYGWSVPVGETRVAGFGDVNILRNNYLDPASNFAPGSSDYITFVHEFAHVLGLAHPHDAGGTSSIFPGVSSPTSTGYFGLNQGVYTTMSYNDGVDNSEDTARGVGYWRQDPQTTVVSSGITEFASSATDTGFGLQSGLMAIDIAALQRLYGANSAFAASNNNYVLPSANVLGTAYTSIWDTGGTDTILAAGTANATIDLRAATLQVAEGGGGFLSNALGIGGGFTIAAGVVIENATGNIGNDTLNGNQAANRLEGGGGDDRLTGFGGKDILLGGAGADQFIFVSDLDSGPTTLSADVISDFDIYADLIDFSAIDANSLVAGNQVFNFVGFTSSFVGTAEVRAAYVSGNTVLYLNTDADMNTESVIVLTGVHLLTGNDFLL
jgi:serralysin